ncbi:hypothetical protein RB653_000177 [Dictyostelium firmibasis]|uniref:peptidylprolyl isomerase n=1 Tax=Dictyostelium firmibasis TaxID=79012 RepID=A0AAN7TUQ9_9MYCE
MLDINNKLNESNEDRGTSEKPLVTKEEEPKKPINFGDYTGIESFRVIFIPSNQDIQPYEVSVSTKESIQTQLDNILNSNYRVMESITKRDSSYVLFPLVNSLTCGLIPNPRASNLFRKKVLLGNALFISFKTIYRDISIEDFLKVEKFISKNLYVQDFENICKSKDHDLVSLITKRSNFQIEKDIWIYKKNQLQVLHEIKFMINDTIFQFKLNTISLKPSGPFYSEFSFDGISFVSKILPQKTTSINSLGNRVLIYLIWRQQKLLFGCNDQFIDSSYEEHKIELENYFKLHKESTQTSKENKTSTETSTNLTTTTTTTAEEFKDTSKSIATDKFKDISSSTVDADKNEEIQLYGITIKKIHPVISIKGKEIYKHVIKSGNGSVYPTIGNSITISYSTRLPNGKIIHDKQKQSIIIGETNCIIGIHYALTSMSLGEHSIIVLDPHYAYGDLGLPGLITPHTKLIVLIEASNQLNTREKSNHDTLIKMNTAEKISAIRTGSELAKNNFNSNRLGRSLRDYKSLENYYSLDFLSKVTQEEWDEIQTLASTNCINMAIVYSKLNRWDRTLHCLKLAIDYDEESSKTHYWISKCYKNGQNYEDAIKEIKLAQKYDSESPNPKMTNDQYKKELEHLNKLLANQELEERKMYKRIFDNLAEEDNQVQTEMEDDLLFNQGNSGDNENIDINNNNDNNSTIGYSNN